MVWKVSATEVHKTKVEINVRSPGACLPASCFPSHFLRSLHKYFAETKLFKKIKELEIYYDFNVQLVRYA